MCCRYVCADDTFTDSGICVECVAFWTFTVEAAKSVDALSTLAQAWQLLALVDVYHGEKKKKSSVAFWIVSVTSVSAYA